MGNPVNIGLVNIMPNVGAYEKLIENAFSQVRGEVVFHPIRLRSHTYHSSLDDIGRYAGFEQTVARVKLDLLIITGAPVENMPWEDIHYWDELCTIIDYAGKHIQSTMGICFGGLALGKYLGINKRILEQKLFGVFPLSLYPGSESCLPLQDTRYQMPMSTWAMLDPDELAKKVGKTVRPLAGHPDIGDIILESMDQRYFLLLGHPEYNIDALLSEWKRDTGRGLSYAKQFDLESFAEMEEKMRLGMCPVIVNWARRHMPGLATARTDETVSI